MTSAAVQAPQGELIGLFAYCDLRTRCKVRRVCTYWKHLVSLPAVNETVLVDYNAIFVYNLESRDRRWLQEGFPPKPPPGGYCYDTIIYGWYDNSSGPYASNPATKAPSIRLTDHQRGGLLGPHVRTLIYDGKNDRDGQWLNYHRELLMLIPSIGMYCTGIKTLILWRLKIEPGVMPLKRSHFANHQPSGFPQPETLIIRDSKFLVAYTQNRLGTSVMEPIVQVPVAFWQDKDQTDEEFFEEVLTCSPAQLGWIAKYAARLPEHYHTWIHTGVVVYQKFGLHVIENNGVRLRLPDFPDVDYAKVDKFLLRILASCMRREWEFVTRPPEEEDGQEVE